jgi:hypothetical protein
MQPLMQNEVFRVVTPCRLVNYLPAFRNVLVPSSRKSISPKIPISTSEKIYASIKRSVLQNLNLHEISCSYVKMDKITKRLIFQ